LTTARIYVFVLVAAVAAISSANGNRAQQRANGAAGQAPALQFERVHALRPDEGVFAYARVTPDGRYLAYASQERNRPRNAPFGRTITVVDLKTREVMYTEPGIDAYWSNDGSRMIYSSAAGAGGVSIRHHPDGPIARQVAPAELGDYYSWAVRGGRNLIVTILSNFYYLDGDRAAMPHGRVPACPAIGTGERPLVSHDGRRITTFVRGTVVVRNLTDCNDIIETGIGGGKADFSWDGRHVAMHVLKEDGRGYEIQVVDLQEKTVRTVTNLPGSSLFPSWLRDGRLFFNYDGDDYRGFVIASDFMNVPTRPLRADRGHVPSNLAWKDLFPETPVPAQNLNLVMVWSTWSAHSPEALIWLQQTREYFADRGKDIGVMTAIEPATRPDDAVAMRKRYDITLPEIRLDPQRFVRTEGKNQIPTTLLFRDGNVADTKLGAQPFVELRDWVLLFDSTVALRDSPTSVSAHR
jgi:hypothetical protein